MRKLILPIVLFGFAIFGFFWYVQPTYGNIRDMQKKMSAYEQTLSDIAKTQKTLNKKLAVRNSITTNQLDRLHRMLPNTIDTVRLLIELDRIAAQHGMSAQNVSFSKANKGADTGVASPATQGNEGNTAASQEGSSAPQSESAPPTAGASGVSQSSNFTTLTMSFSVSGPYSDMLKFLRDLERSSRLMDVTKLKLTTPQSTDTAAANTYSFTVQTYQFNTSGA